MHNFFRPIVVGLVCAVAVIFAVMWSRGARTVPAPKPEPEVAAKAVIDYECLADAGLALASQFTGAAADPGSLADLRESIGQRGPGGLATLEAELAGLAKSLAAHDLQPAML